MAIDLSDTIPSIITSLKNSNSNRAIQKLTRNLKPCEKNSLNLFSGPKSCLIELSEILIDYNKSNHAECRGFDNNNESEREGDCEKNLLSEMETDLGKLHEWNLKNEEKKKMKKMKTKKKKKMMMMMMTNGEKDVGESRFWSKSQNFCVKHRRRQENSPSKSSVEIGKRRKRVFLLSSLGLALLSLAIFIRLYDPLEKILNWTLNMAPGTFAFNLWLSPPVALYVKIYIFNFTNPDEFLAGKEKLKVQQLGPFVYAEHLVNGNPVFNSNGTLSYIPKRIVNPVPEMSAGDPKSVRLNVPNIPFLGIASMISDSSAFTNLAFMTLTKYLGSKPFLNVTVHEYLWGYDDSLVRMANKVIAAKIPFSRFGLLDRMYDEGDNVITIRLRDNGLKITDKGYLPQYSIDTWNGSPGLEAWGYKPEDYDAEEPVRPEPNERCKLIRGASDGVIFPRNVSPKLVHQVFRKSFCRMIPLVFEREGFARNGLPAYWYKLPENVFDTPSTNPSQACYCNPNSTRCLPKGLSDITPCYYNIPAAVSFPHFLAGDPSLLEKVEGLSPDEEKHGTKIILQPNLGIPMEFQTRIQTNIVMRRLRFDSRIIRFSETTLPILWIELELVGLPVYITCLLYLIVFAAPGFVIVFVVVCSVSGFTILIYSAAELLIVEGCVNGESRYLSFVRISAAANKRKPDVIDKGNKASEIGG